MTKITDIKTTKKGRYALFCDEGFLFSVDEVTLYDFNIKIYSELSDEQLSRLRDQSDSRRAISKGLDFLSYRPHSAGELRDKLMRTFDADTADYAVTYLESIGYIDDSDFAALCCEEYIALRHKSISETRNKLYQKRLSRDAIEAALSPYEGCDAENALWTLKNKYAGKDRDKAYAALARRGFSSAAIRAALRQSGEEDVYDE